MGDMAVVLDPWAPWPGDERFDWALYDDSFVGGRRGVAGLRFAFGGCGWGLSRAAVDWALRNEHVYHRIAAGRARETISWSPRFGATTTTTTARRS